MADQPAPLAVGRVSPGILLAILMAGLVACSMLPPNGISRSAAEAIALRLPGAERVISSTAGPAGQLGGTTAVFDDPDRLVWAVVLGGTFPGDCRPAPSGQHCAPDTTTELVLMDYHSGEVFYVARPADGG